MPRRLKKGPSSKQQVELYDKITKLEEEFYEELAFLMKKCRKTLPCRHLLIENGEVEPKNPAVNYYDKFWKTFLFNQISKSLVASEMKQQQQLRRGLLSIERKLQLRRELVPQTRGRPRSKARNEQGRHQSKKEVSLMIVEEAVECEEEEGELGREEKEEQFIYIARDDYQMFSSSIEPPLDMAAQASSEGQDEEDQK